MLEGLALDPVQAHAHVTGQAAVDEGLDQRLVGVGQARVLAHYGDGDLAVGVGHAVGHPLPAGQVGLGGGSQKAEDVEHFPVEALLVIVDGHGVDVGRVHGLDDRALPDIAELADLAALGRRDGLLAAAQQDVRLDADGPQFLDGVLGRLGLHLPGRLDVGQEGQVDVAGHAPGQLLAQLADGLEEGQALDVAHRAADLDQDEVDALTRIGQDEGLDLVGDVRNDLDRRAQIVAAALLLDDGLVDLAGGDVVPPGGVDPGETLVVAQVEVGLGTVLGHEDLAMLVGAHRPRIDVEVGVELAQANAIAARLEERAECRGGETFSQGGDHAAGDEDVPGHGRPVSRDSPVLADRR